MNSIGINLKILLYTFLCSNMAVYNIFVFNNLLITNIQTNKNRIIQRYNIKMYQVILRKLLYYTIVPTKTKMHVTFNFIA